MSYQNQEMHEQWRKPLIKKVNELTFGRISLFIWMTFHILKLNKHQVPQGIFVLIHPQSVENNKYTLQNQYNSESRRDGKK